MRVNGSQVQYIAATPMVKAMSSELFELRKQLKQVNEAYLHIFENETYKSDLLSRKHAASLYNKVCLFLEQGSTEQRNQKKQQFCVIFRDFVCQFVEGYAVHALKKCVEDYDFVRVLIEKWEQFKRFCYFYVFLLKVAQSHYEMSYKLYINQAKSNKIENAQSTFPLPAIAIHYFQKSIYNCYKPQITRIIREMLSQQRQGRIIERDILRSLFQIVYSCGLAQLARINAVKRDNNQVSFEFHQTQNKEIQKYYTNANKNPDCNFFKNILNVIIEDSDHYYTQLFHQKISGLGPHEDFSTVAQILQKEEDIVENYFLSNPQKTAYLCHIKQIIVMTNLQQRLTRENSLKSCLQKFDPSQEEYITEIRLYIDILFKAKQLSIKTLQNVVSEYLSEAGSRINEKISKRREHMIEMVGLKKGINRIIDEAMHKDLSICIVRDKCFRKILDSIEASRNLADFIDFKVKESIKNKLGEVEMADNMKDIFLILQNLAATDSFLIYHQQLMGRRLLEPLNEPRLDIEKHILKRIAQQLGSVTTNAHFLMIKDIEKSQQITENYSKKMPFARFKWNCRIMSPQFWSDNMNNNTMEMILPEAMRVESQMIRQLYHEEFSRYLNLKIEKGFSLFQGNFKAGKFRFQSQNIFLMLLFHIAQAKGYEMHFWELMKKITKHKDGGVNYLIKCVKVLIDNGLVLRNNPNSAEPITETQKLRINTDFKPAPGTKPNQTIIIKVSPQMLRSMHETSVQNSKIMKERERVIEAVLVKLLKHSHSTGNNRISLENLVKGVREYQHLKNFDISESTIKQRLEELIARGYCERNDKDRKLYHYVA